MSLYASTYPSFSNDEIIDIKKSSGKEAVSRIHEYNKTIQSYKKYSSLKQLTKTNLYLNKLEYKDDKLNNNKSDHWATPKEFLTCGLGDCEDYAIIKYFSLLKLGFSSDKLFITLAYDTYSKRGHMVLSYFMEDNKPPLILDNLSVEVLNLAKRSDLVVNAFINTNGVYKFNDNGKLIKTKYNSKKFKALLKRVQMES